VGAVPHTLRTMQIVSFTQSRAVAVLSVNLTAIVAFEARDKGPKGSPETRLTVMGGDEYFVADTPDEIQNGLRKCLGTVFAKLTNEDGKTIYLNPALLVAFERKAPQGARRVVTAITMAGAKMGAISINVFAHPYRVREDSDQVAVAFNEANLAAVGGA